MKFELRNLVAMGAAVAWMLPTCANSACNADISADAPDTRYTVSGEVVSDNYTGLTWKRCGEGWSGSDCATGTALSVNWQDALKRVVTVNASASTLGAGFSDWRLPNRNELASLVERQCVNPAINAAVFPGTASQSFWTSSPYALNGSLAWYVGFDVGDVAPLPKTGLRNLRLVRAGN
jgi:hypothetical protein